MILSIKNKKTIIIFVSIVFFLFLIVIGGINAKYVYKKIQGMIYESNEFYFNSESMSLLGTKYQFNNWDGVSDYVITLDINNKLNGNTWTKYDISYTVDVSCPSSVSCTIPTGINDVLMYNDSSSSTNLIDILVHPFDTFKTFDEISIKVEATSKTKYHKTIVSDILLSVISEGINYEIDDTSNQMYANLIVSNASTDEKNLEITFDDTKFQVDMSNSDILNVSDSNNNGYIDKFTLNVGSNSAKLVSFYKEDITKNYSYPSTTSDYEEYINILEK